MGSKKSWLELRGVWVCSLGARQEDVWGTEASRSAFWSSLMCSTFTQGN